MQVTDDSSCSPTVYTGTVCLLELQEWQICLPERQNETHVLIPSDIDQELKEKEAKLLFTKLQQWSPNNTCQGEFRSFWCLLLFGICDGRGQRRLPSYDQCIYLQQHDTCDQVFTETLYTTYFQGCNITNTSTPLLCGKITYLLMTGVNYTSHAQLCSTGLLLILGTLFSSFSLN